MASEGFGIFESAPYLAQIAQKVISDETDILAGF
jgi:hypothetical protein